MLRVESSWRLVEKGFSVPYGTFFGQNRSSVLTQPALSVATVSFVLVAILFMPSQLNVSMLFTSLD